MESTKQREWRSLCDEIDAKSQDYQQEVDKLSNELAHSFGRTTPSVFSEHEELLPRPRESLSRDGLPQRRRLKISYWL